MYQIRLKSSTRSISVRHIAHNVTLKHVGKRGLQGIQGEPGEVLVSSVNGRIGNVAGLAEQTSLDSHTSNVSNPHAVTKTQVGLGSVDNTSDISKNSASAVLSNKTIDGGTY